MPELPEVETVRAGVAAHVLGRRISGVDVLHPRAVRRHGLGAADFAAAPVGLVVTAVRRRGKYMWLELDDALESEPEGGGSAGIAGGLCMVVHLGMSGQLLLDRPDRAAQAHLRVRIRFAGDVDELRFVDQRTFGGLVVDRLVATEDASDAVPALVAHIARDPLDPLFDEPAWQRRARRSRSEIKRTLLDQRLISGVGNIYADESLWRAKLNGTRPASSLSAATMNALLASVRSVMTEALVAGGTSFDALYVNVNGQSGHFDRSLAVYGRQDRPCRRCGTAIRRSAFMNRSSFWCPRCQRPARARSEAARDRRRPVRLLT